MHNISCPHCKEMFKIDETGYINIVKQVRDASFKAEVEERLKLVDEEKRSAIELAKNQVHQSLSDSLSKKELEIQSLHNALEQVKASEQHALDDVENKHKQETQSLLHQIKTLQDEIQKAAEMARLQHEKELMNSRRSKEQEIVELKKELHIIKSDHETKLLLAVKDIEKERDHLQNSLQHADNERQISEARLKVEYEVRIKDRDEQIERLRDMKARLSTKMVGETLEQHCETEFNRIRTTAFPNAYFEKDNDARTGSKGDYIFRDYDHDNTEIVSIMFEMKNESDMTATKKRNEDFFKELDKDRQQKNCEYAVLVSLLEADSELYNSGIVDVSYRYPKMYVIRPQFFIPLITLLRNASVKSLEYKTELELVKRQHVDITNFESNLETFKEAFGKNFDLYSRQSQSAIDEIDKSIDRLQKTKSFLEKAHRNLRLAQDKAQDITIKRLTKNSPTMEKKLNQLTQL